MELSWVAQVGTVELAFGALSGWVMALVVDMPDLVRGAGVRSMARIRQAHIDYIIMGVILIALGLALPGLPRLWQVLLVAGAAAPWSSADPATTPVAPDPNPLAGLCSIQYRCRLKG